MDEDFDVFGDSHDVVDEVVNEVPVQESHEEPAAEPGNTDPAQDAATVTAEKTEAKDGPVPLATFLDMRDKMKEQRAEAEALRRQLDTYQNQQRQQNQPQLPDPQSDPHGYAHAYSQMIEEQVSQRLFDQSLQFHGHLAVQQHGEEKMNNIIAWAEPELRNDPALATEFRKQTNPVDFLIRRYEQAQHLKAFADAGSDPVAYARKIAEAQGWFAQAPATASTAVANTTASSKERPTTLTGLPAASSKATPTSEKASFDDIFNPHQRN